MSYNKGSLSTFMIISGSVTIQSSGTDFVDGAVTMAANGSPAAQESFLGLHIPDAFSDKNSGWLF